MADNYLITEGSDRSMGADEISSVLFPRIKLIYGADGVNSGDVSGTNPLPIQIGDGSHFASVRDTGSSDSLNVSIVDASGNQIVTFKSTQYVEDVAFGGNGTGTLMVARRDDALSTLTPIEDDAVGLRVNSKGALWIAHDGTITCTDTASQVDDAAFAPATSRVLMFGAEFDDVAPDSVDEGDGGALRMSANRNLYSTIRDAAGNERGANVNSSNRLLVNIEGTYAEDSGHTSSDVGHFSLAVRNDSVAQLSNTDMDYTPFSVNNRGALWVLLSDGGTSSVFKAEDSVAVSGDPGFMSLAVIQATLSASAADGDYGSLKTEALGKLWVTGTFPTQTAYAAGNPGNLMMGVYNASGATSYATSGQLSPAAVTNQGAVCVQITSDFQESNSRGILKRQDAASASQDAGVAVMLKRGDTATSQVSTDGDYLNQIGNSFGAAQINIDSTFQASSVTGLLKLKSGTASTAGLAGVQSLFYTNTDLGGALVAGDNMFCPAAVAVNGALYVISATSTGVSNVRSEDAAFAGGNAVSVGGTQRQDTPTNDVSADSDVVPMKSNTLGYLYVDPILRSTPSETNPSITTATSTQLLAANAARRYMMVQNNSAANIMISLANFTLTGIVPSSTNKGIVIIPGGSYESPGNWCSNSAITVYQTSGGTITSISVEEA